MTKTHAQVRLFLAITLAASLALPTLACRVPHNPSDGDGDADGDGDGDADGDSDGDGDSDPLDPCGRPVCGDNELCGTDGRGDGFDNDCDGQVDEDCLCAAMVDSQSCFPGAPDRRNLGACSDGVQTCSEFGIWDFCVGAVTPVDEICNGMDDDCDGSVDEELPGCESSMTCPSGQGAAPLSSFSLIGTDIYDGPFTSWRWDVECPPTVPDGSCPQPSDPNAQNTEVYFIASGTYRITVTIETPEGPFECSFAVWIQGAGLRVELNWDTQGSAHGDTDVDLHLHRPGTNADWFTDDDCYFSNCTAGSHEWGDAVDWGMPNTTDISACSQAPHGNGDTWTGLGYCANPRLDVDIVTCNSDQTDATEYDFCSPENINVDNPSQDDVFRVMVNYYSEHSHSGATHPSVNIFCGGALRASFGIAGDVALTHGSDYGESNDNWMVADLRFYTDECGNLTCEVEPLETIIQGPDFGPPWTW